MGVDIYSLSRMHYVEADLPKEIKDYFEPAEEVRNRYPSEQWFVEVWNPPEKPWYKIQEKAYKLGYIRETTIGKARCMFFRVNEVIHLYRETLREDAFGLYGIRRRLDPQLAQT